MKTEVWKPLFNGRVEVSNRGRVRKVTYLSVHVDPKGYFRTAITLDSIWRVYFVHSLVARAFNGKPKAGFCVDHKNGNKQDNRPTNLEYVTVQENTRRAVNMGLFASGEKSGSAKLSNKQAALIRKKYKTGRYSHRSLAKLYGVDTANITRLIAGETYK